MDRPIDWHRLYADEHPVNAAVVSRRRLWVCLDGFIVVLGVVFGRVVQLEVSQGEAFRAQAARPLLRRESLPGVRGRILAADGSVLARDKKTLSLAVHYRYLEDPPNERWLRRTARSQLTRAERKDSERIEAARNELLAQRRQLAKRLARLCGVPPESWHRRVARIQTRVRRIADSVYRRRLAECDRRKGETARPDDLHAAEPTSTARRIGRFLLDVLEGSVDDLPPTRVTVTEELDYHVMAEDVPRSVVAQVEAHPELYPGVRIIERSRREYPSGTLAANVLGHLGAIGEEELAAAGTDRYRPGDRVGRMGLERQYEQLLRARRGVAVRQTDHGGRVLSSYRQREPGVGRDLILTLDLRLQRTAETLLDEALARRVLAGRALGRGEVEPAGGVIVVMDVRGGAILAAASAPRFDPNLFAQPPSRSESKPAQLRELLSDPARPLFARVRSMAIPPGSVFKTISAVALLETLAVDPQEPFHCRGYLKHPDQMRCAIYRRRGVGHGDVTLRDALAQSCNVYFFHPVGRMGPRPLVDWAEAFGFGRPTGVDLPGEASGTVPTPETRRLKGRAWRTGDTQLTAIGQGRLTATPLQVVRMMAAVASDGRLVTPHLVSRAEKGTRFNLPERPGGCFAQIKPGPFFGSRAIPGLKVSTLEEIREGLRRVVSDGKGTAHDTVYMESIAVAGKTGTAQTGADRADHAWFAGYVPADSPKLAFVVVLEHSGNGGEVAGPVAKRLVIRMRQLGLFRWGVRSRKRPGDMPGDEQSESPGGSLRQPDSRSSRTRG